MSEISIHLTYYHLDSRREKTFLCHILLDGLETYFRDLITPYLNWMQ